MSGQTREQEANEQEPVKKPERQSCWAGNHKFGGWRWVGTGHVKTCQRCGLERVK